MVSSVKDQVHIGHTEDRSNNHLEYWSTHCPARVPKDLRKHAFESPPESPEGNSGHVPPPLSRGGIIGPLRYELGKQKWATFRSINLVLLFEESHQFSSALFVFFVFLLIRLILESYHQVVKCWDNGVGIRHEYFFSPESPVKRSNTPLNVTLFLCNAVMLGWGGECFDAIVGFVRMWSGWEWR